MGRLIDAGLLLDHLSGRLESMKDYDAIKDVVNNMPTAYKVDEVVQQLEGLRKECEDILQDYCPEYFIDRAIEIVKGGGVNDEC